jgi:outer membrane murein-binding lipoprotein Lpp
LIGRLRSNTDNFSKEVDKLNSKLQTLKNKNEQLLSDNALAKKLLNDA